MTLEELDALHSDLQPRDEALLKRLLRRYSRARLAYRLERNSAAVARRKSLRAKRAGKVTHGLLAHTVRITEADIR